MRDEKNLKVRGLWKKKRELKKEIENKYLYNDNFKRRVDYAEARSKYSVQDNIILYESFFGRGMVCNPYALFLQMRKDVRFENFKHVWVLDDLNQHERELEEYKNDDSVIFIERGNLEYFKYLSSAKYLINNSTFPTYYTKKEGQVIINTWHGIPLKHLGFDEPRGNCIASNTLRNFLMTDYLISANKFTTNNFREAYKLEGIYQGNIIETGYPRNDTIFNASRDYVISKMRAYGVDIDPNKKIVLYAPTWKGEQFGKPVINLEEYNSFLDTVYKYVDEEKVQVLFKPHQSVYKTLKEDGELQSNFIPATLDTNEILSVTDVLVSDYSSIFFDYLVTGRPILFYIPDLEKYEQGRGLYLDVDMLPGLISKDCNQIGKWIGDIGNYKEQFDYQKYKDFKSWAVEYDDGFVAERIIDVILGNEKNTIVHKDFFNGKIKLLINNNTMKTNGITTSVTNLIENIDYDKYDVTLCAGGGMDKIEAEDNICKINKNARVVYRNSAYNGTRKQILDNELTMFYGVKNAKKRNCFPTELYENAYNRLFPNTSFDYVIDFSGYPNFMSLMLASNKKAKKLIWMHNDMLAERERFEEGERKFSVLGTIYPLYDRLVSCSHSVMEVNQENLETTELKGKFSYARNLISYDRIDKCLKEDLWLDYQDGYYIKTKKAIAGGKRILTLITNVNEDCINFVTMGRLSMEKNHENLIRAFADLYQENNKIRLYILGEGPLKSKLNKLIKTLNLEGKIVLTGNLFNPFGFVNKCDCYIMPSLHEGQPMAILEARMLNMPIVVSNFSTVKDSLYDKGQLLIGQSVEDIYEGMKAFCDGKVPNEFKFKVDEYNKFGIEEFEASLKFD